MLVFILIALDNKYMKHEVNKDWISLGIGTCLLEILALTTIATIVKYLSPEIQIITILFFRYAFSLPLLFLFGFFQRGKNLLRINRRLTLAIRIVVGITGLASYFMAIGIIGIGKTIALGQLVTIFITILAPIILAEKVGVRRWIAVIIGFLGSLIIINPSQEGWLSYGILWGLNSALFSALLNIFLRKLGSTDHPISTALWYNIVGSGLFTFLFLFMNYSLPEDKYVLLILIASGALSSIQQFLLAFSRSLAPAIILAPLQYLAVPISFFVAINFFDENLGLNFILGSCIIIGSTFYISLKPKW